MVDRPVDQPTVQNRRDQTDDERAARCGPEAADRKAFDEVGGQLQQQRIQHDEKEAQREHDQGEGQDEQDGPENEVQNSQDQDGRQTCADAVRFDAGDDGHGQKDGDTGDQHARDNSPRPSVKGRFVDHPGKVNLRHPSLYCPYCPDAAGALLAAE
ncbi:hypothetical protein NITMOv2_0571 [Nitrospira moscoviensis]|uniref:Uncharacterized protein n=1 Tax=Nitrospira moscoviensis TaxID=42253 RepID=A0A0K2G8T6_NITMO|nr:hypothetical protein NITMOv2_0571 [Nitrospira moscoviensis]